MRRFISFAFFLLLLPAIAQAAPTPDQPGADTLKKSIESAVSFYAASAKALSQGISVDGMVTVVPQKSYYEVTLPNVKMTYRGGQIQAGAVRMFAVPQSDGSYITTVALPAAFKIMNQDGTAAEAEVKIAKQKFTGTWRPDLMSFSKLDAEYNGFAVNWLNGEDIKGTIDSLKATLDLKKNADGTLTGPAEALINGFTLHIAGKEGTNTVIKLAQSDSKFFYDKMNLAESARIRTEAAKTFNGKTAPTPEDLRTFSHEVVKSSMNFMDGQTNSFELSNLSIDIAPPPALNGGEAKPVSIKAAKLSGAIGMMGMLQDKGNATIRLAMEDLDVSNADPSVKDSLPRSGNIDISLTDLPLKALSQVFADFVDQAINASIASAGKAPDAAATKKAQDQVAASLLVLPGIISSSGAKLEIKNTYLKSNSLTAMLDGKIATHPVAASAAGATPYSGTLNFALQGVDELTTRLQSQIKTTNDQNLIQFAQGLAIFQAFGQPAKAANGQSLRKYKIDLTPDGKILLNDADLGSVMKAFAPQK